MKMKEIKELSSVNLLQQIDENENNLVDLQFTHELKQLTNTAKLRETKKDIARMKTALRMKEIAEAANTNSKGAKK